MLYRDHRGTLADSMETIREINSLNELKEYLNNSWKWCNKTVEEILITHYEYDERIDWDTYIVTAKMSGEKEFWIMGFANGDLR